MFVSLQYGSAPTFQMPMTLLNNSSSGAISVNGLIGASISAADRGLAFGDGVFETLRVRHHSIPLWQYHRERLMWGCQSLHIPLDIQSVEQWSKELLKNHDFGVDPGVHGTLKIIVTRGVGGRGYGIDTALTPTVICSLHPSAAEPETPVNLHMCRQRLARNPVLAGLKHLNRLENVLLKAECRQAGFDDGLVFDDEFVIEAVSSNVFFERDGELFTPDLNLCGVKGVMRRFILEELAPELGVRVNVQQIPARELDTFSSAFCCNSVRGIVPVSTLVNSEDKDSVSFSESSMVKRLETSLKAGRFYK